MKHVAIYIRVSTEAQDTRSQLDDLNRYINSLPPDTQVVRYDDKFSGKTMNRPGWNALQAVTRYVDHERSVRGDDSVSDAEKRFVSSQFGSGENMKAQAMALLMPRIKDKVLVAV